MMEVENHIFGSEVFFATEFLNHFVPVSEPQIDLEMARIRKFTLLWQTAANLNLAV